MQIAEHALIDWQQIYTNFTLV